MEEGEEYRFSLKEEDKIIIDQLHRLYYFTVNQDHYLKIGENKFRMFEPTKFVYSYFCFSTLFNYNWSKIKFDHKITLHEKREEFYKGKLKMRDLEEYVKTERYISFIFENIKSSHRLSFIKDIMNGYELKQIHEIIESINVIDNDKKCLKKSFNYIIENYKHDLDNTTFINKIINIVNIIRTVRNNVFHGTKDVLKMVDENQKNRLMFYSNFINSINKQFFPIILDITNIDLVDVDKKGYRIEWSQIN